MDGLGGIALLSLAELVVVVFALITVLGDGWFMLVGLSALYWAGPRIADDARPVAAVVVGFATLGLAVVLALKSATAIPRPATTPIDPTVLPAVIGPFVAGELDASGFSFPSGHAVGSTVVYGGLGLLLTVGRRRLRYVIAASAAILISLSRIVLEVHYPIDMLAGIGTGVILLAVGVVVATDGERYRPDRVFLLAGAGALVGFAVALSAGHSREIQQGAIAIGTAAGGIVTWHRFGDQLRRCPAVSLPIGVLGLLTAGGLWISAYIGRLTLGSTMVASAAGVAVILLLPLVSQWLKKRR